MAAGKAKSRFGLPAGLARSAPKRRPIRVADAIKGEIASLLLRKINDPRLLNVIITSVEVSDDLSHARVLYSFLGEVQAKDVAKGLESCKGFIRTNLARALELRHVPVLDFHLDLAGQKQAEMEQLLREIANEDGSSP
ncbi:30S ribosome-binding factor RbfA [Thiovibrio frasassiensis]|jgi:ribosome-binding factor A|uniref:Ribosome-binding factor A n=1 Tax=Thiovibrio frasassiensis TaxID=2984131 RepID=A0A9X4ME25_9BACT|nr:30S ribosome-binding factor RbfA [Thiovibrio frasassiensis]MDG4474882.1 30S ribosome-binding factor RbfA [Thiovibrio frasassiensis]